MTTLIIDPSSTVVGWVIMQNQRIMAWGIIDASKCDYADRFPHIAEGLRAIWRPDISEIVIEKPVLVRYKDAKGKTQSRDNSALRVACRAIKGWAKKKAKRPIYEHHPSTWKSKLIGSPNASKEDVRKYVEALYPMLPKDLSEHIIDAIAIGLYHNKARELGVI